MQDCDDAPEVEKEPAGQTLETGDGAGADAKLHHVAPAEDVDPAGHGLQEACPAVSWYIPAAHFMQADVAAPPLL